MRKVLLLAPRVRKKCTKTQHSGDQPFVMSQRALIALLGDRGRREATAKQQS